MNSRDTLACYFLLRQLTQQCDTGVFFLFHVYTVMVNHEVLRVAKNWLKGCSTQVHHPPDTGRIGFKYNSSQKAREANAFVVFFFIWSSERKHHQGKRRKEKEGSKKEKEKSTLARLMTHLNSFSMRFTPNQEKPHFYPLLKVLKVINISV